MQNNYINHINSIPNHIGYSMTFLNSLNIQPKLNSARSMLTKIHLHANWMYLQQTYVKSKEKTQFQIVTSHGGEFTSRLFYCTTDAKFCVSKSVVRWPMFSLKLFLQHNRESSFFFFVYLFMQ